MDGEERVCNYAPLRPPHSPPPSDPSTHPRALFKMTILIDSLRPNYDLSAVGMRWMKSRCNWGIGLRPCWRSWRRTELCGFSFPPHTLCMCACVCVFLCILWELQPLLQHRSRQSVTDHWSKQRYGCCVCSFPVSGSCFLAILLLSAAGIEQNSFFFFLTFFFTFFGNLCSLKKSHLKKNDESELFSAGWNMTGPIRIILGGTGGSYSQDLVAV